MAAETNTGSRYAAVDGALAAWRQGDCVLGQHWFVHRLDPSLPVTETGTAAAATETDLAEALVLGLVVVTQTCDVVRPCVERPYIEVCPLVEVPDADLRQIERGRRPRYGYVSQLADRRLVADLDRTMTVEKPVEAKWERTLGWSTDAQARALQLRLPGSACALRFPTTSPRWRRRFRAG